MHKVEDKIRQREKLAVINVEKIFLNLKKDTIVKLKDIPSIKSYLKEKAHKDKMKAGSPTKT